MRTLEGHAGAINAVCVTNDGRVALTAGEDGTLRTWMLDWASDENTPADGDEAARPYLETFLTLYTPYAAALPDDADPSGDAVARALAHRGTPRWTDADFNDLLFTIRCAGGGWLRPDGIRRELERMAGTWHLAP